MYIDGPLCIEDNRNSGWNRVDLAGRGDKKINFLRFGTFFMGYWKKVSAIFLLTEIEGKSFGIIFFQSTNCIFFLGGCS